MKSRTLDPDFKRKKILKDITHNQWKCKTK